MGFFVLFFLGFFFYSLLFCSMQSALLSDEVNCVAMLTALSLSLSVSLSLFTLLIFFLMVTIIEVHMLRV